MVQPLKSVIRMATKDDEDVEESPDTAEPQADFDEGDLPLFSQM